MIWLEELMYQVSGVFLAPVLLLLVVLFAYACYATGCFIMQAWQRRQHKHSYFALLSAQQQASGTVAIKGYPLLSLALSKPHTNKDDLDVAALKELEGVRAVSRIAPMLGLIATMVPMGPALKSLANGNVQGISENLIIAFSAVIFGLVIASITFWIASVKKRWMATELVDIANAKDRRSFPSFEAES